MEGIPRPEAINAEKVEQRLQDAGRILLALPWSGCFPAGFQSLWPERAVAPADRPAPTSAEIAAMVEAYRWTALIGDPDERRLVLMRSLVLGCTPRGSPRYVWSWRRLQKTTGLHRDTLMARWGRGIDRIVRGLNARDVPAAGRAPAGFRPASPRKLAENLTGP